MNVNVAGLKALKKTGLITALIELLAGIVFILLPKLLPHGILIAVGVIAMIIGVLLGVIVMMQPKVYTSWKSFILPVLITALGLFILVQPTTTITIIGLGLGIATILKGIGNLLPSDVPIERKKYIIFGIISIIIGIVIIMLSLNGTIEAIFSYVIGADLIFNAIVDLLINRDIGKIIKSAGNDENIFVELN